MFFRFLRRDDAGEPQTLGCLGSHFGSQLCSEPHLAGFNFSCTLNVTCDPTMLVDVARRRLRDWPKPAISSMGESVSGTRATANPRPTDSREARCQVQTVLDITSEVPDTRRPQDAAG